MSTRSALDPTRSVTVESGRVNLNAFCSRFPTTAARICRSASMVTLASTGNTMRVMPRALASNVAAYATSSAQQSVVAVDDDSAVLADEAASQFVTALVAEPWSTTRRSRRRSWVTCARP